MRYNGGDRLRYQAEDEDKDKDEDELDYLQTPQARVSRRLSSLATTRPMKLADTTAQAEAHRPPPKISDLPEYSSETEEDSEDSLGSDNSDSDDLPNAEDYEIVDLRGKNVPPWAKDKAVAVNKVAPVRKRRRFEDYLDN